MAAIAYYGYRRLAQSIEPGVPMTTKCFVVGRTLDDHTYHLEPRHDLRNHSPDGFEWSYNGSGPAQLALALCADVLDDDDEALEVYQAFKTKVVAGLAHEGWALSRDEILRVIDDIRTRRAHKEDE